jgi:hypothetical protein
MVTAYRRLSPNDRVPVICDECIVLCAKVVRRDNRPNRLGQRDRGLFCPSPGLRRAEPWRRLVERSLGETRSPAFDGILDSAM